MAEALSEKKAERLRKRLQETLLAGGLDSRAAKEAEQRVSERDARWLEQRQEAEAQVKRSARTAWIVLGVLRFLLLYIGGLGTYFSLSD